jgi:hypothetical protein
VGAAARIAAGEVPFGQYVEALTAFTEGELAPDLEQFRRLNPPGRQGGYKGRKDKGFGFHQQGAPS